MQDAYDFWSARIAGDSLAEIEAMWERFAQVADQTAKALAKAEPERGRDLALLMPEVLGELGDHLEWDFAAGPAGPETHTLVLTAGERHQNRVLARAVLDNAPDLRGWAFADARPAVDKPADAPDAIRARDGGRALALSGVQAATGAHRRIDLTPKGDGDPPVLAQQAELAFEVLLGEDVARDWMGRHEAKKRGLLGRLAGRRGGSAAWCEPFRDTCRRLIADVRGHLPDKPFAEQPYDRSSYVMYSANRLENNPTWRHDTITGYTSYRAMAHARMSGDPLASARFSRFGECFCGLKVARTPDFHFDETEQRIALAEGAHLLLCSREEGGVTGEAVGRSHVYIDLALTQLSGGVATLAELLDKIELTGPAWLIFDEAGLTGNAIPLTPRTPAAPKTSY